MSASAMLFFLGALGSLIGFMATLIRPEPPDGLTDVEEETRTKKMVIAIAICVGLALVGMARIAVTLARSNYLGA